MVPWGQEVEVKIRAIGNKEPMYGKRVLGNSTFSERVAYYDLKKVIGLLQDQGIALFIMI